MEVIETLRFTGFHVLEQAEGRVWRGEGTEGKKKLRRYGSKGPNVGVY
jgi:hypothetical protein